MVWSKTAEGQDGAIKGADTEAGRDRRQLREVQPTQIRYGTSYDTSGGVGGDLRHLEPQLRSAGREEIGLAVPLRRAAPRGASPSNTAGVNLPALPKTTARSIIREELNPPTRADRSRSTTGRKGASIQQERKLRNAYVPTYGYRLEQATYAGPTPRRGLDEADKSRR